SQRRREKLILKTAFQHRWEAEYMFTDIAGKPVCLISGANVAVIKEFNLRRHYETKRQDKLKNLNAEQKLQKVEELKKNLTFHEAVVKASFIVAEAKSARPFTTLKCCMMKVCDVLSPVKTQILANVSLGRNTIADRVCEMATDLRTQLCERSKTFIAYSLAVDESTDMMGIAHVTDMKLPWDKLVGLTTDGALVLCGEKKWTINSISLTSSYTRKCCGKVLKMEHVMITVMQTSFMWEIDSEFADIPYHTEVRWLSWGKVLNRVFELSKKILKLSQMHQYNFATVFPNAHFADKLSALSSEFQAASQPIYVETAPVQIQMELQCNGTLKAKYNTEWPAQFISSIPEAIPQLRLHAARTLCITLHNNLARQQIDNMMISISCVCVRQTGGSGILMANKAWWMTHFSIEVLNPPTSWWVSYQANSCSSSPPTGQEIYWRGS
uniref:DUF4371 domain-containing protein n=1 Tax=Pundamilia nyererei TaxID=303518 RepID=A0A3B4FC09_9CICH